MSNSLTAIIADDEPLLREALERDLSSLWPELSIVDTAANGNAAIESMMQCQPDIAFLDIQMPGATGIEAAETLVEEWPDGTHLTPPPLIVFVTAYDTYAVDAFNAAAFDYLLKPVTTVRLKSTISRLKQRLRSANVIDIQQLGTQLRTFLDTEQTEIPIAARTEHSLRIIRASVGEVVKMIPIDDVILFESADKYVTVYTKNHEALIRESLRSLLPQLDRNQFAQIHRSAIVNLNRVEAAVKDDSGKLTLQLSEIEKKPTVSRLYRHLFQAM